MKKFILTGLVLAGFTVSGSAQENNGQKPERIKLYKVESPTTTGSTTQSNQNGQKFASAEEEIQYCKGHIEALDKKEEWIRQNPEEHKIALENGWYENAEKQRTELRARIAELEKELK